MENNEQTMEIKVDAQPVKTELPITSDTKAVVVPEKVEKKEEQHMRLLLTMILKDDSEIDELGRMLTSFMPYFDGLAVAITGIGGEKNRIKALIKKHKGRYIEISPETNPEVYSKDKNGQWFFSNFANARNACFKFADSLEEKYDWWSWGDVDDVLIGGEELQSIARQSVTLKLDSVFFTYWYAVAIRDDGSFGEETVQIQHLRERLIKPSIYKWVSPLHEISVPKEDSYRPTNSVYDFNQKENRFCAWVHLTSKDRIKGASKRNIQILEQQRRDEMAKGQDDPRTIFYLAKSYFDEGGKVNLDLADMMLDDYLEKSGWAEERASAWEYKANIMARRGSHRLAIDCLHMAIKEFGNRHMPYLLLAREYGEVGDWEQSDFWLDVATHMESPKARTTIGNPMEIKFLAASLKYNQALRKPDIKEALHWMEVRNKIAQSPDDDNMLYTLRELNTRNDACMWVFNYCKWLKDTGHRNRIKSVLDSMPLELGRELFAHQIANEVAEPRVWGEKEVAFYASWGAEHFEGWSPKNMKTGIGGSETAVIQLAQRWAQAGYKVTVFGDPRDDAGDYDGVEYKPYYAMNWNDTFNILILWRSPHLLDKEIKAKKIFMDLHDIASQLDWTEPRMAKVDKVFFKSKFHRNMIPKLPEEKAVIISNGI